MIRLLQRHLIAWCLLHPEHAAPADFGTSSSGVRDDDGKSGPRTRRATEAARRYYGMTTASERDLTAEIRFELSHGWVGGLQAVGRTLGERALAVALSEWVEGVAEEPRGSNGGPRIGDYFAVCERQGRPVTMRAGEWCAASASWCLKVAAHAEEPLPHGFRVSGAELVTDMKDRKTWRRVEDVRRGRYEPGPGDLVILSRDGGWTRHVCRLATVRGQYLWTLGGNEGDEWRLTPRRLSDARLLGLGAYPR